MSAKKLRQNMSDSDEESVVSVRRPYLFTYLLCPQLSKLMGHIAFGASVGACVTLSVPTVTF